jgi:hypothetical protein
LEIRFPAGVTVVGTGKDAFRGGDFATGNFTEVNTNDPSMVKLAIVGTSGKNGPISIGCVDVTLGATFAGGEITLVAEPNNENSDPIAVTVQGVTLQGTPTTGTTTGETTGTTTGATTGTTTGSTTGGTCTPPTNAAGEIDITDVSGTAGQTVSVAITTTKTGIAGADLVIRFDPAVLTFAGARADFVTGNIFASTPFIEVNTNNVATGEIRAAIVSTDNSTAAGTVVTFPLVIAANAGPNAFASVNLEATLNDANSDVVAATVGNGVVTIGTGCGETTGSTTGTTTGTTTGSTTGTTTGSTTGGPTPILGDVDGNGTINVTDVREAIRVLFGLNTGTNARLAADWDSDGDVDLIDIRRLLQRVVTGG